MKNRTDQKIKEALLRSEQKILTSLNLFASEIEFIGYTPKTHQKFTKRMLEDIASEFSWIVREREEQIKADIIQFAIEGKNVSDEMKGLTLYSKIMDYFYKLKQIKERNDR